MDQERKYVNNLKRGANAAEDTITSELYDDNNYFDIEREPEIEQHVSTSMFIKNTIENLNTNAVNQDLVSTEIGSEPNNYKMNGHKLTTKQQLLKEVGAVISSNRSNVGRLRARKASVSTQQQY